MAAGLVAARAGRALGLVVAHKDLVGLAVGRGRKGLAVQVKGLVVGLDLVVVSRWVDRAAVRAVPVDLGRGKVVREGLVALRAGLAPARVGRLRRMMAGID